MVDGDVVLNVEANGLVSRAESGGPEEIFILNSAQCRKPAVYWHRKT